MEGKFRVDSTGPLSEEDQLLGVLSVLMVIMLERARG
jgi:hypothetical protein